MGSLYCILGAQEKIFISSIKFRLLLLATLSVPMATLTPFSKSRGTLHTPLANFRLLTGLQATVTPLFLNMSISSSVTQTQWAAVVGVSKSPNSSRYAAGVFPLLSIHPSCSNTVSDRWRCILAPISFVYSAKALPVPGSEVYSPWRLISTRILPLPAPW